MTRRIAAIGVGIGLVVCASCASQKKAELIYEEPVTSVWTGNGQARQQPAAQPPPTGFPDPSVTTVVVPDQNPTTQTTLKRRTGWVRGGYD